MEKLELPKLKLLYTKEQLLEYAEKLKSDSKKESQEALSAIAKHAHLFVAQLIDYSAKVQHNFNCFRTKHKFNFTSLSHVDLYAISTWRCVYAFREFRFIDKYGNAKMIWHIDNLTDEDFFIKSCECAKQNALNELNASINGIRDEFKRFNGDIEKLNQIL